MPKRIRAAWVAYANCELLLRRGNVRSSNKQLLRSARHPVERVDDRMHLRRAVYRARLTALQSAQFKIGRPLARSRARFCRNGARVTLCFGASRSPVLRGSAGMQPALPDIRSFSTRRRVWIALPRCYTLRAAADELELRTSF